jgi:hypothetical protein
MPGPGSTNEQSTLVGKQNRHFDRRMIHSQDIALTESSVIHELSDGEPVSGTVRVRSLLSRLQLQRFEIECRCIEFIVADFGCLQIDPNRTAGVALKVLYDYIHIRDFMGSFGAAFHTSDSKLARGVLQ